MKLSILFASLFLVGIVAQADNPPGKRDLPVLTADLSKDDLRSIGRAACDATPAPLEGQSRPAEQPNCFELLMKFTDEERPRGHSTSLDLLMNICFLKSESDYFESVDMKFDGVYKDYTKRCVVAGLEKSIEVDPLHMGFYHAAKCVSAFDIFGDTHPGAKAIVALNLGLPAKEHEYDRYDTTTGRSRRSWKSYEEIEHKVQESMSGKCEIGIP